MEKVDKEHYSIEVIDGILFYTCKTKILSKEAVLKGTEDRIKLSNNKDQYIISDMLKVGYWPASARNELAKKEHQKYVKRAAVIIKSNLIITLLNWFLLIAKVEVPTKIFSTKEAAIRWIQKHQKLEQQD